MKIHERMFKVQEASATLGLYLIDLQQKHGLTFIELAQILNEVQASKLKYALRYERHGNYEKVRGAVLLVQTRRHGTLKVSVGGDDV